MTSDTDPPTKETPKLPPRLTRNGAYAFHAQGDALVWDYIRGIGSLAVVIGVISVIPAFGVVWWILVVLAGLIVTYVINVIYRHGLRVEMDDRGLMAGWRNPIDATGGIVTHSRRMMWSDLKSISVRYFSRGRFTQNGWTMAKFEGVTPDGAAVTITIDGDHEAFQPSLRAAWEEVTRRDLALDEATLANLDLLGISTSEGAPWMS